MTKSEYQKMFEAETSYFWFVAKQALVDRILSRIELGKDPKILDLGCGTGNNLKHLEKLGFAIGLDRFSEALDYSRKRGLKELVLSEQEILPFADRTFDLVLSLDTIEHSERPEEMIQEVFRILKPGGFFLITAPSFQFLYSRHDLALRHKIRYNRKQLGKLLKSAGFEVELSGHFYGILFPLGWTLKILQKFFGSKTNTLPYYLPFPLNQILLAICRIEIQLFPYLRLPFGTTLVFLAKKSK